VKFNISSGTLGWVALAGGVLVWDLTAGETLTSAFRRSHDSPVSLVVVTAAWTLLTAHLFSLIPPRLDPMQFEHYARIARKTQLDRYYAHFHPTTEEAQ
jgi:hypothetical protein